MVAALLASLVRAFALLMRGERRFYTSFPLVFLVFFIIANITESRILFRNDLIWTVFMAVGFLLASQVRVKLGAPVASARVESGASLMVSPAESGPHARVCKVAICMTTFRRPEGAMSALSGIAGQVFPRTGSVDPSSSWSTTTRPRPCANGRGIAADYPFPLVYACETRQGVASARNRCLDLVPADADYMVAQFPRANAGDRRRMRDTATSEAAASSRSCASITCRGSTPRTRASAAPGR